MKIVDDRSVIDNIAPFATNCGAACYKTVDGGYIDLFFLRSFFDLNQGSMSPIEGETDLQHQKSEVQLAKVASVTLPAQQARELIRAIEDQLKRLEEL
ncbi:hypothetical protein [Pantoea dispersa]|uniref:hypothetical protein n=1 Tax=Pantoea dispersa TaxID=59814 RepID=UPI00241FAF44|nr:hypothetical protein [Pantoea dispersa]